MPVPWEIIWPDASTDTDRGRIMYQTGQLILYGKTGVCRVEGTTSKAVTRAQTARLYYVLHPLYQAGSILAPVDNVDSGKIFSRPIMGRDEAQTFIRDLPALKSEPYYNQNLSQLREHYREQLGSLTGRDLALLICSIYRKKQKTRSENKKLGAVDQQFMDEAEDLLYGELAASLGIARDEVKGYISRTLDEDRQPKI